MKRLRAIGKAANSQCRINSVFQTKELPARILNTYVSGPIDEVIETGASLYLILGLSVTSIEDWLSASSRIVTATELRVNGFRLLASGSQTVTAAELRVYGFRFSASVKWHRGSSISTFRSRPTEGSMILGERGSPRLTLSRPPKGSTTLRATGSNLDSHLRTKFQITCICKAGRTSSALVRVKPSINQLTQLLGINRSPGCP